ncbi:hypothetical protein ACLKA6_006947 [Drosophila palustris]
MFPVAVMRTPTTTPMGAICHAHFGDCFWGLGFQLELGVVGRHSAATLIVHWLPLGCCVATTVPVNLVATTHRFFITAQASFKFTKLLSWRHPKDLKLFHIICLGVLTCQMLDSIYPFQT